MNAINEQNAKIAQYFDSLKNRDAKHKDTKPYAMTMSGRHHNTLSITNFTADCMRKEGKTRDEIFTYRKKASVCNLKDIIVLSQSMLDNLNESEDIIANEE